LGKEQLNWVKNALAASYAPFKIVAIGGQVLTSSQRNETYINLCAEEREDLLTFIEKEGIKGVIFLTGDVHYSELSAIQNAAGNWVFDLTTSPLTSGVNTDGPNRTDNEHRVPGTAVGEHNFSLLRFFGPRNERMVEIKVVNADGKELWTRKLGYDGVKQ
jgi:Phosphodiesterase/alkaline phosphatase D